MDLIEVKIKLYQKCIEKQKEIIENSQSAMDEAQTAANEYGAPKDRYDSFRAQLLRKRDLFAEQYNKSLKEFDFLKSLRPENRCKSATTNSLIITDKQRFYVSIGLGKVEIPEGEFFVISPLAPIFQALKEKTTGETVVFNGQKIKILDLI
jgi:hypothetical protein